MEVKDVAILNDPLLTDGLGYDDKVAIQTPANKHLGRRLVIPEVIIHTLRQLCFAGSLSGNPHDGGVSKLLPFSDGRIGFNHDALCLAVGDELFSVQERVQLKLIHCKRKTHEKDGALLLYLIFAQWPLSTLEC